MKTPLWRWLALLALPGCLVVQPLDEAKSDDMGGGGRSASAGAPASSGSTGAPKGGSGGAPGRGGAPSSGGAPSTPGTGGSPGTGAAGGGPSQNCDQTTLPSGDYGEKTIVGICFAILWDGLTCSFDPSLDETDCLGDNNSFYIVYSETADGTQGDIYDLATDTHLGITYQDADENYQYELITGSSLTCYVTANTARLCVN